MLDMEKDNVTVAEKLASQRLTEALNNTSQKPNPNLES